MEQKLQRGMLYMLNLLRLAAFEIIKQRVPIAVLLAYLYKFPNSNRANGAEIIRFTYPDFLRY